MSTKVTTGILATLKAKPGKEAEVEEFLKSALPLANQEPATTVWFALKLNAAFTLVIKLGRILMGRESST